MGAPRHAEREERVEAMRQDMVRTERLQGRLGGIGAAAAALMLAVAVSACGQGEASYPEKVGPNQIDPAGSNKKREGIFGNDGIRLFGGRSNEEDRGGGGIGVNGYLWRASLDSLAFMPIAQADPFGGVILTDWYAPPETPQERFKVNVFILGRQLRADGLKAVVFRQTRHNNGNWIDAVVEPHTATELENTILTRARQIRVDQAGS